MQSITIQPVELALALGAAIVVGAFIGFYLRASLEARQRKRRERARAAAPAATTLGREVRPEPRPSGRPHLDVEPGLTVVRDAPEPRKRAPAGRTARKPAGTGPMILLADDRFELRAVNAAYLAGHGYQVLEADDGEAALDMARRMRPDAIVLDHSMPRRTGMEVVHELKADPATAGIPIVFMTAHSYGAIGRTAMAAGCAAYLHKPCDPSRVLQEVARHTPASGARA